MGYDVNWLLSSVAQASAAMIAIVGGLLVTRYVGLHAEQQAAGRRLDDLRSRAVSAREQIDADRLEVKTIEAADIVDDVRVFAAIVDTKGPLPVKNVFNLTGNDPGDYDEDLVQGQLASVTGQLLDAFVTLDPMVNEETTHESWAWFQNAHPELRVGHRNAWSWAYERVCDHKRNKAVANLDSIQRTVHNAQQLYRTPSLELPRIRFDTPQVRERLALRIDNAETVANESEREAVLAEEAYEATRQPEGFSLALRVLLTLALCGVVPPVILMVIGADWGYPWVPAGVALLFLLGLSTLLRFLFVYASFLQRGGRTVLPQHVWALFLREKGTNVK